MLELVLATDDGVKGTFPIPFNAFQARTGRPSKLTDDLLTELQVLIAFTPLPKKRLCALLGIVHQTCRNWEKQGEQDQAAGLDTPESVFLDLFEKGQAYWQMKLLHWQLQGGQDWARCATMLERLWPEEYGRRMDDSNAPKVIVQIGINDSDVTVNASLSPVQRNELAA